MSSENMNVAGHSVGPARNWVKHVEGYCGLNYLIGRDVEYFVILSDVLL